METISDAAEYWIKLTFDQFWCELANHASGCLHACKYPSAEAANLAMLRLVYLKGRSDATTPPADFEEDVKRVTEKIRS